ncbi:MAG: beta strand repeat-containing protein [Ilumatobacteraceae bacterium]
MSTGLVASSPAAADTGCQTATPASLVNGFYEIDSAAKLQWLKDTGDKSASYKLTADINMSGCSWATGIGNSTPFSGTFDGNGKAISNITVSGYQYRGLFSYVSGSVIDLTLNSPNVTTTAGFGGGLVGELMASGSISNVTLNNVVVNSSNPGGGAIGVARPNSTVNGVTVSGTVSANIGGGVGGVIGHGHGSLTNLTSSATVTGDGTVGGLVGALGVYAELSNSIATGNVTGTGTAVGGVAGTVNGSSGANCPTLTAVTASGIVQGSAYVGGLAGYGSCYSIYQSSSSSTVTATSTGANANAGGLVGSDNYANRIEKSFFTGQVQGSEVVGGITGSSFSVIVDSYSTGTVTATLATNGGRAGGLVGLMKSAGVSSPAPEIVNSYARGAVTPPSGSDSTTGGLVGDYQAGTITSSVWDTETTGRATSQGTGARGYTSQQLKDYVLFNSDNLNWSITDGISSGNGVSTGTAWSVCSGANSGYPFLTRQGLTGTCLPTMAYNGNGHTGGAAPTDPITPYTSGATVTVLGDTGSMTKTGYFFTGWNTKADGSGTPYSEGDTFTITSPVMLFAQWTSVPTVSYRSNGGSGAIPSQSAAAGAAVTLNGGSGFTRSGYVLSRWDTSSMGNGTSYSLGQSISMPAGGLSLWAIWTVDPSATTTSTTSTTVATTTSPATTVPSSTTSTTVADKSSSAGGQTGGGTVSNALPPQSGRTTATTTATPATTTTTLASDIPDVGGVGGGDAGATLGGQPVSPEISDDGGSIVISVGEATVRYTILDSSGTRRTLSAARVVEVQSGDVVTVQLTGFATESMATSWLVPNDTVLGSTKLSNGEGTISGAVPDDATPGLHRLVTEADSRSGESLVIAYGVNVNGNVSDGPSWSFVFLVFVGLAIAAGWLVPAARRRREDEDES